MNKDDVFDAAVSRLVMSHLDREPLSKQIRHELCAMYAAGAEDMRERTARICDERTDYDWSNMAGRCAVEIRALPITPTNTEGEQA